MRISTATNDEGHRSRPSLAHRVVVKRFRIFREVAILPRFDHTYNFQRLLTLSTDEDAFAHCALTRPERLGHLLINDDYALRLRLIAIVKVTPLDKRNLHGLEITGANDIVHDVSPGCPTRESFAFFENWTTRVGAVAEWKRACECSRFNARHVRHAFNHLPVKTPCLLLFVTNQRRTKRQQQTVAIIETRIHRLRFAKTLDKQTATHQHHQ